MSLQHDLGNPSLLELQQTLYAVPSVSRDSQTGREAFDTRPPTVVSTGNKALPVVARGSVPERDSVHPTPRSAQRRRWIRADQWLAFSTTSRVHAVGREVTHDARMMTLVAERSAAPVPVARDGILISTQQAVSTGSP
jgi:hypothetical protein